MLADCGSMIPKFGMGPEVGSHEFSVRKDFQQSSSDYSLIRWFRRVRWHSAQSRSAGFIPMAVDSVMAHHIFKKFFEGPGARPGEGGNKKAARGSLNEFFRARRQSVTVRRK
jgi:hypothetical protein